MHTMVLPYSVPPYCTWYHGRYCQKTQSYIVEKGPEQTGGTIDTKRHLVLSIEVIEPNRYIYSVVRREVISPVTSTPPPRTVQRHREGGGRGQKDSVSDSDTVTDGRGRERTRGETHRTQAGTELYLVPALLGTWYLVA